MQSTNDTGASKAVSELQRMRDKVTSLQARLDALVRENAERFQKYMAQGTVALKAANDARESELALRSEYAARLVELENGLAENGKKEKRIHELEEERDVLRLAVGALAEPCPAVAGQVPWQVAAAEEAPWQVEVYTRSLQASLFFEVSGRVSAVRSSEDVVARGTEWAFAAYVRSLADPGQVQRIAQGTVATVEDALRACDDAMRAASGGAEAQQDKTGRASCGFCKRPIASEVDWNLSDDGQREQADVPPKCWDQEEHRILVLEAQVRALGGTP